MHISTAHAERQSKLWRTGKTDSVLFVQLERHTEQRRCVNEQKFDIDLDGVNLAGVNNVRLDPNSTLKI